MSEGNKKSLIQSLDSFSGLRDEVRDQCVAAVSVSHAENKDCTSWSPSTRQFLTQVEVLNSVTAKPSPWRREMITIISDEFVAKSKNSGSNNQENEGITAPSVSASLNPEVSTAPTTKILKFSSTGKWENAVSSHFASVDDVWKQHGPFKKLRTRDSGGIQEYKCVSPTCAVQLRLTVKDYNRVDLIGEHNHAPISWKERLEEKKAALPPMVLSYVDSLIGQVRRRQLTPQDVCRMAEQEFCLDESLGINENRDARDTFYRKIKNRIAYQRKKTTRTKALNYQWFTQLIF
jgi:hypothetical protein